MPRVLPLGVTLDGFWELNVHKVNILVKAFNEKEKTNLRKQNTLMHLQGRYFMEALLATVGNMFKSRGQVPYEYPNEPYHLDLDYEEGVKTKEEREIELKRKQFVHNLNSLFGNIERAMEGKDAED